MTRCNFTAENLAGEKKMEEKKTGYGRGRRISGDVL
jgi:hypothetical protein